MMRGRYLIGVTLASSMALTMALASCPGQTSQPQEDAVPGAAGWNRGFQGYYEQVPFEHDPSLPDVDLSDLDWLAAERTAYAAGWYGPVDPLFNNGIFIFKPHHTRLTGDFVGVFEFLEDEGVPPFVSSDLVLFMMHLYFDAALEELERNHLREDLVQLCQALHAVGNRRLEGVQEGSDEEGMYVLYAAYTGVALECLNARTSLCSNPVVARLIDSEMSLIDAAAGFSESPVFGYLLDYSQYIPRGHYAGDEELESYFRAMMWLGNSVFLVNGGEPSGPAAEFLVPARTARLQTGAAIALALDVASLESFSGESLEDIWLRIYRTTAFFAGFADDPTLPDYRMVFEDTPINVLVPNQLAIQSFYEGIRPGLNEVSRQLIYGGTGGAMISPSAVEPTGDDLEDVLTRTAGMRFLGQRYTPDSHLLGRVVYPTVGQNPSGIPRTMPSALDVAAFLGSSRAEALLAESGVTAYEGYTEVLEEMRNAFEGQELGGFRSNLYMSWLHLLSSQLGSLALDGAPEGYPVFMRSPIWSLKSMSSALASWAMLRHDTILYAKQSYTVPVGGPPPVARPLPGYVEPVPELYAEVRALLGMMKRGLDDMGILDQPMNLSIQRAEDLITTIQEISQKELRGEDLSDGEREFLLGFAAQLQGALPNTGYTPLEGSTVLVADVHTDPTTGTVLEVASGHLDMAVVVYQTGDGLLGVAAGPVLSFYEFTMPLSARLTDERWESMLSTDAAPGRPAWTGYVGIQDELVDR